jgi:hypothetical protein
LCHFPCGRVAVLSEYRDVVYVSLVFIDKLGRLYEHTARTAAGVVYAAAIGLQHFYQRADNTGRGVELSGQFAFSLGKL